MEAAGFILSHTPLLLGGMTQSVENLLGSHTKGVLRFLWPSVLFVMERVEKHVLRAEDQQIVEFMTSYTSSFQMTGVAGAIIAQVAISALSLQGLETSHWTATAFFIASLVSGSLSVFFSCVMSPAFHGLHTAEEIKSFLTSTTLAELFKKPPMEIAKMTKSQLGILDRHLKHSADERYPSFCAAVMLVLPITLLNIALNTFLIGLGVYLGKIWSARLIPAYGSGALAILIIYICITLGALFTFYTSQHMKYLSTASLDRWQSTLNEYSSMRQELVHTRDEDLVSVIYASIHGRFDPMVDWRDRIGGLDGLEEGRGTTSAHNQHLREVENDRDSPPTSEEVSLACERSGTFNNDHADEKPTSNPDNLEKLLKRLVEIQEETLGINKRMVELRSTN